MNLASAALDGSNGGAFPQLEPGMVDRSMPYGVVERHAAGDASLLRAFAYQFPPEYMRVAERITMSGVDIFVVDDERVVGQTLGIILRQAGYSVQVFQHPYTALQALRCPPRLLLTDQTMPSLSGTSLASMFATACPGIAVLVFSGDLLEADVEWQSLNRQIIYGRLLHKPLHPSQIVKAVQEAITDAKPCHVPLPSQVYQRSPITRPGLLDRVMRDSPPAAMMVR